jgi:hypothetical protein
LLSFVPESSKKVAIGMKNTATARDIRSVETIETPIFLPIILIRKLVVKIKGKNTTTVVRVEPTTGATSSEVAASTASGRSP